MSGDVQEPREQDALPFLQHLEDLRKVIIVSLAAIGLASIGAFIFVSQILEILLRPLKPLGIKPMFTGVAEGLFFKFKVALVAGVILAAPVIIWQIWRFVVPALYPNEKRYVLRLVPISIVLFAGGVVLGYYTIFPILVYVLINLAAEFTPLINVSQYLSFTLSFLIPFGLMFEFPVVIYFLAQIGVVKPELLISKRKYAIVIIIILAAVLTPGPDPISQLIMAAPMLILYEAGIIVSKLVVRKKRNRAVELANEEV